jgi:hypothetical protein
VWRNNIGNVEARTGHRVAFGVGGPGGADLLGIDHRGRFVALEIKTPVGRISTEQRKFGELVAKHGGVFRVLRSVDDARALLAELEAST